jgi:hypothetical protein
LLFEEGIVLMLRKMVCSTAAALLWPGLWLVAGTTPLTAQTLTFAPVGSISGPIDLVRAAGDFAYVTVGETLTVYDLSNPAAPVRRGMYSFPEKVWGFKVVGSLVYVAAGHSGFWIVDVSNPDTPMLKGSVKTPGQAKNVAVSGQRAVVADHMAGVDVVDVSDLTAPVSIGSVYTDGYARDVAIVGSQAYAVDHPAGFYVLDMMAADPLEPVGSLQSASAPRFVEILDSDPNIAVLVGGIPYDPLRVLRQEAAPDDPSGTLQLYDVSDPASPVAIGTYPTPGDAQRAELKGSLAYIADGPAGLSVVDLSTPSQPEVVGTYQTRRSARDVAVADTAILILDGTIRRGSHSQDDGDVIILRQNEN